MSNTTRTRDQLWALFPDNVIRLISPQRDRDFIASAFPFLSTVDPGPNNDRADTAGAGAFFDFGSRWLNLTTQTVWYCMDGQPTAAVWVPLVTGPLPPTPTPLTPGSIHFDGFTQYLGYSGSAFDLPPGVAFSFVGWFNSISVSDNTPFIIDVTNSDYFLIEQVSGNWGVVLQTGGTGVASYVGPVGPTFAWHFVCVTYDPGANVVTFQADGGARITLPMGGPFLGLIGGLVTLGAERYNGVTAYYYPGWVDSFGVFDYALTDDDARSLWNNGDGVYFNQMPCCLLSNCRLWFDLDESSGDRFDSVSAGAVALVPVNDPTKGPPICGFRAPCLPLTGPPLPVSLLSGPGTIDPALLPPPGPAAFAGAALAPSGPASVTIPSHQSNHWMTFPAVFSTVVFDTASFATAANEFTAATTGRYRITLNGLADNTGGAGNVPWDLYPTAWVTVNGSPVLNLSIGEFGFMQVGAGDADWTAWQSVWNTGTTLATVVLLGTAVLELTAGDTVVLKLAASADNSGGGVAMNMVTTFIETQLTFEFLG
jgi:Concanavalin A-like lectin/glucanases superfamily